MTERADAATAAFHRFLAAVHTRDPEAVVACFAPAARYGNVPHPPAIGRDAIRAMLAPILTRSSEVDWEVLTEAVSGDSVIAERVDRFVIDGTEYAARCCGVFVVDPRSGLLVEVRDYVDLEPWRSSIADVVTRPHGT